MVLLIPRTNTTEIENNQLLSPDPFHIYITADNLPFRRTYLSLEIHSSTNGKVVDFQIFATNNEASINTLLLLNLKYSKTNSKNNLGWNGRFKPIIATISFPHHIQLPSDISTNYRKKCTSTQPQCQHFVLHLSIHLSKPFWGKIPSMVNFIMILTNTYIN